MFKGSIVALITPFKDNRLDEDCYISLISHHLKNGTSGLVPAGTTGESATLTFEEHCRVIDRAVKFSDGRIPIVGVGGIDSKQSAWDAVISGASLLQLYSALVFNGPTIVSSIVKGLQRRVSESGFSSISEAVGYKHI